jgi:hypothetical protein
MEEIKSGAAGADESTGARSGKGNAPKPQKPAAPKREKRGLKSVDEWRELLGNPLLHPGAAHLHGWDGPHIAKHAEQMRVTEGDYRAALDAAARPGPNGHYLAHKPACSDAVADRRKFQPDAEEKA